MAHQLSGRLRAIFVVATIVAGGFVPAGATLAQGARYSGHQAWAVYHIDGLPGELRARVLKLRAACGLPFAATHSFAVPATVGADHFMTLHFENLWCENGRQMTCRGDNCLHEIYAKSNGRYRLALKVYAREARLSQRNGGVVLRIFGSTASPDASLLWKDHAFVAARRIDSVTNAVDSMLEP